MFVVVGGGWPGSLISLLFLDLPVQGAFLLARYHKYFKSSRYCVLPWHQSIEFEGPKACDGAIFYMLFGRPDFLRCILTALDRCKQLIGTVDIKCCKATRPVLSRAVADGHRLLQEFGLCPLVVGNVVTGGATDAHHLLRFEDDLSSPCIPSVEAGLHRMV